MTTTLDTRTLTRVGTAWDDAERAALLRARPNGLTWPQITAEVDTWFSALAFWHDLHPAGLFDDGAESPVAQPAEIDALLAGAARG